MRWYAQHLHHQQVRGSCTRCNSQLAHQQCQTHAWVGGFFVAINNASLCKYCANHNADEVSVYMHTTLTGTGVLTCISVPQIKVLASLFIHTATQPRGELESVLDILINRVPENLRVRTIYTSSHYVLFCFKNLSRVAGNDRYMNQDHLLELQRVLGNVLIMHNKDRGMKLLLESFASNVANDRHMDYPGWSICKLV